MQVNLNACFRLESMAVLQRKWWSWRAASPRCLLLTAAHHAGNPVTALRPAWRSGQRITKRAVPIYPRSTHSPFKITRNAIVLVSSCQKENRLASNQKTPGAGIGCKAVSKPVRLQRIFGSVREIYQKLDTWQELFCVSCLCTIV